MGQNSQEVTRAGAEILALWRVIAIINHALVGIRLHTQGMSVEDGAKVFEQKAFQEPANAYEEARRGAYNPTYLSYTFGKLQIQDLRAEYRARTGRSLRDFHDAFIAQDGLPLPLVRRILLHDAPRSAAGSR